MAGLSADDLLTIWEEGQGRSPLHQALVMLTVAYPTQSAEQLTQLSIEQRDLQLLTLREQTFGSQLQSVAACPACQEQLEFLLSVRDICDPTMLINMGLPATEHEVEVEGYTLTFRLPTSEDLLAVQQANGETVGQDASQKILQRCLLKATHREEVMTWAALPDAVQVSFRAALAAAAPQAEILLSLACPACEHQWSLLFDIVSYFWREIAAQAQRLLQEVHVLARAYGWREADILAMSAARRRSYLAMVGA